jgi:hypothetical protein
MIMNGNSYHILYLWKYRTSNSFHTLKSSRESFHTQTKELFQPYKDIDESWDLTLVFWVLHEFLINGIKGGNVMVWKIYPRQQRQCKQITMNSFQHLRPENTQMNFGIPGTLGVKFGIFACQTNNYSTYFLSSYCYLIILYINIKGPPYINYNPLFQIITYFIL